MTKPFPRLKEICLALAGVKIEKKHGRPCFTANGKIKRKKAGMRHFMRRRSVRAKRNLRNRGYVDKAQADFIRGLLPNG